MWSEIQSRLCAIGRSVQHFTLNSLEVAWYALLVMRYAICNRVICMQANVGLSVAKDRAFTRMFGKGSAKPLPIPSYMLFGARDSLTILAGFSLPPIISKEFIQPVFHIPKKTADVISQLTVPCVMQFISTPLHLLGLHLYNYRQSDGASRLANIRHFYWGTAFARIGRIFPAFGIGGVVNRQLRETLKEKYT